MDLLAVVFGDKPAPLLVNLSKIIAKNEDTYIVASSWCKSGNRFDNARK